MLCANQSSDELISPDSTDEETEIRRSNSIIYETTESEYESSIADDDSSKSSDESLSPPVARPPPKPSTKKNKKIKPTWKNGHLIADEHELEFSPEKVQQILEDH